MTHLKQDYLVYVKHHELQAMSSVKKMAWLILRTTFSIVLFYRLSKSANILVRIFAIPVYKLIRIVSNVQISRQVNIGGGLLLPHFGTIVLNKKAIFGTNLTLFHGVTVGAKGASSDDHGLPVIGNNVRLSAGAIVLGNITIGDNVVVGAGTVVVKNIPKNSVVAGNPARIL
jgi:serine acetyltransferase